MSFVLTLYVIGLAVLLMMGILTGYTFLLYTVCFVAFSGIASVVGGFLYYAFDQRE